MTLTATSVGTVSAPVTGLTPHLPAGMTKYCECSYKALIANNSGYNSTGPSDPFGVLLGRMERFDSNASINSDTTAPASPPTSYRHKFPTGLTPGSGSGHFNMVPVQAINNGMTHVGYRKWYDAIFFRMPGANFEIGGGGGFIKLFGYQGLTSATVSDVGTFDGNQQSGAIIVGAYTINGSPSGAGTTLATTIGVTIRTQIIGTADVNYTGSFCGVVGHFTRLERYFQLGTPGQPNSICQMWTTDMVTNVTSMCFNRSDLVLNSTTMNGGMSVWHDDQIWNTEGGTTSKSRDDYFDTDHYIMYGALPV